MGFWGSAWDTLKNTPVGPIGFGNMLYKAYGGGDDAPPEATPNWTAPQLNRGDFTSAAAARLGPAAQGLGQVRQFGGAQIDPATGQPSRDAQAQLLAQLQAQSRGEGVSPAQLQYQQGADNALQNAMRLQATGRGGASQLGAYQTSQMGAGLTAQASQQAAIQKAQEQLSAQQGIANVSGQMYGEDYGLAAQNAGLREQTGLANMGAYNGQLGQDLAARNQFGLAQGGFDQQANMANAGGRQAYAMGQNANDVWAQGGANGYAMYLDQQARAKAAADKAMANGIIGGAYNTAGGVATMGMGGASGFNLGGQGQQQPLGYGGQSGDYTGSQAGGYTGQQGGWGNPVQDYGWGTGAAAGGQGY